MINQQEKKNGANILLVLANSTMDNFVPLGISLLSACLKKAGHNVLLFDTTFYKTREETGDDARVKSLQVAKTDLTQYGIYPKENLEGDFRKIIEEFKPDLIAASAIEITYPIALRLLNSIKDLNIPKIVGGIHPTLTPESVISEACADMICIGEGEEAIVELADSIRDRKDYSNIKNLWVKKGSTIIKNGLRNLVDLNTLPFQDWTIYEKKRFYKPMGGKIYVMGNVEVNRSCMNKCTYCANAALNKLYEGKGRYYREKDMKIVMKELRYLKDRFKLQYLYFIAENFLAMSDSRFEEFVELYKDIKIPFYIDTRPETLTEYKIKKIAELGCEGIAMGIECGDDEFRRKMLKRYMTNDLIINAAKRVKENSNIRLSVNNIIGFPFETREIIFKTIELNRKVKSDYIMVNIFNPYHGTELRRIAVENKFIEKDALAGDYRSDYILDMPNLSKEELLGLRRTFPLYVRFPKDMWPEIAKAEKFDEEGNKVFKKLAKIYSEKYFSSHKA